MSKLRIYPSKSNTIRSGKFFENLNSSKNVITDLVFGGSGSRNSISRFLIQFDISDLQSKFNDYSINQSSVQSFNLRLKNSTPSDKFLEPEYEFDVLNKQIASSFSLIAFKVPKQWDEGRGFDLFDQRFIVKTHGETILSGMSNWLSATTVTSWDEQGIFNNPTASTGFYVSQDFGTGNEDINMDITPIMNDWLSGGSQNYGLCIAYTRPFELISGSTQYLSSFYTNHTNSAFKPYLEVNYNQNIVDDRNNVTNNRISRLFLYLYSGNTQANYLSGGTVTIKNSANVEIYTGLTINQLSKGVYYVDVHMSGTTRGQKYKDIWKGISFSTIDQQDITQSFEIRDNYYSNSAKEPNEYAISTYGLDNNAILTNKDEIVRIFVVTRFAYSLKRPFIPYGIQYKLTMNLSDEIIPWEELNHIIIDGSMKSYFDLDTSFLLGSQNYEITFRIVELGTKRILPEKINFRILDNFDSIKN